MHRRTAIYYFRRVCGGKKKVNTKFGIYSSRFCFPNHPPLPLTTTHPVGGWLVKTDFENRFHLTILSSINISQDTHTHTHSAPHVVRRLDAMRTSYAFHRVVENWILNLAENIKTRVASRPKTRKKKKILENNNIESTTLSSRPGGGVFLVSYGIRHKDTSNRYRPLEISQIRF